MGVMSLPMRGAWIEISDYGMHFGQVKKSLPMRGAWIEIGIYSTVTMSTRVAPHAGGVD